MSMRKGENDLHQEKGLPNVGEAFASFNQPEMDEAKAFKSFSDADLEWGDIGTGVKKIVIQDSTASIQQQRQQWSCGNCDGTFPKVQQLWAHLDTCTVKKTSDARDRSLPPVPKFVYESVQRPVVVIGEDEEGGAEIRHRWTEPEFDAEAFVPRHGWSLMTEEEQVRLAIEASTDQAMIPHGMSEDEQWALQNSASMDHVSDAEIRALELDREMDDMQIAMALSVMDLPMDEYFMGKDAYELSCKDLQISPYGVLMAPQVLDILHGMGILNGKCPKCQVNKRPGNCTHFLPDDLADLMKMRRVCKQWMVCIDNWIRHRKIMKSIADCHRCHLMHYKVPTLILPHFAQAKWCNLKIKLSNDYVIEDEVFPCHYPLHNKDQVLWKQIYHQQ